MSRLLSCLVTLISLLCAPAGAVMPGPHAREDAQRFGLARGPERRGSATRAQASYATRRFNARHGGMSPLGALAGPRARANPPGPGQAAQAFLAESRDVLGVDPAGLVLESETSAPGHKHALFRQVYQGLPVEFSRVKVHMDDNGAVTGFNSNFTPVGGLDLTPTVSKAAAMDAAAKDAGAARAESAELVILPDLYGPGPSRLAWKATVQAKDAVWRYYVDAHGAQVVFRYNDLRMVCANPVQGTVTGPVYAVDPGNTPPQIYQPFPHERVFVGDGLHWAETDSTGFYCASNVGKISTQLQGSDVSVSNFLGGNAHFDNGNGTWLTAPTPVSSPHPYPDNAVLISTIDLTAVAPGAFAVAPVFTNFKVGAVSTGGFGESSDISDDDTAFVVDPFGNPVAGFVGNKGTFVGAAVPGPVARIMLKSNNDGSVNYGYDIAISSYLVMASPGTVGTSNNVAWSTTTNTALPLHGEFSLFYHLNLMHDYFASLMGPLASTYLTSPAEAMAWAGPNLINAFYNPDTDNLFFGDTCGSSRPGDCFADDATVPHHEYVHYVVEKIWRIQNFGQAGAISEANADYFSASSFSSPLFGSRSISGVGAYVYSQFGNPFTPLREADWQASVGDVCGSRAGVQDVLTASTWQGEIHCDDRFVLQALWDIRKAAIAAVGASNGPNCADGLVFQALLSFPESFEEYLQALQRVASAGSVAACSTWPGGGSVVANAIATAFANHGLGPANGADAGFETAIDVSTMPSTSGAILTAGQVNFYTFGAGPGAINVTMTLPASTLYRQFNEAYMLTLYDLNHNIVAQVIPTLDGYGTSGGFCSALGGVNDCTTTQKQVVLTYNGSAGGQYFVEVNAAPTDTGGSNSFNTSLNPYQLAFSYPHASVFSGVLVSAQFDRDTIGFTVQVTTYAHTQDYSFAYAQLRDQSQNPMPQTLTTMGAGGYLQVVSSQNALGKITGTLQLAQLAQSFSQRFPSVGTVYLEVFGYNVAGSTVSLGLSNAINLGSNGSSDLAAWNNVFNPLAGQKATIKYSVPSSGRLTIRLYTLNGTFVQTLFDGQVTAGEGSVDWSGRNLASNVVASGIYLVQAHGAGLNKTVKVAVVK